MQFTLFCIVFIDAALALYPNPYGNPTGDILLCTDDACRTNAFVNEWGMGGDFCSVLPPPTSYGPPSILGSYLITLRPTCDNGSYADWATYGDTTCSKEKTRVPYNNDDTCESFAGVAAVAFICNGFGDSGGSSQTSSAVLQTVSTIDIATASSSTKTVGTATAQLTTSSSSTISSPALSSSVSTVGRSGGNTTTSATHSTPSAISTGGVAPRSSRSQFGLLAIPACLLLAGI